MHVTIRQILVLLTFVVAFAGCTHNRTPHNNVDIHTSRNSLDWSGVYEGVLACASCFGIATTLTLRRDGSYELQTKYLDQEVESVVENGQFKWDANGIVIALKFRGVTREFAVNEGRLLFLNLDGTHPDPLGKQHILNRIGSLQDLPRNLSQVLESHSWMVKTAIDQKGRIIEPLLPTKESQFVLIFSKSNVNVRGGCNGFRGGYEVTSPGVGGASQLNVGVLASTMVGCEPEVMEADAILSAILAEPMKIEVVVGKQLTLTLSTADNKVIELLGTPTPESLYGPPTTVFLEVASQLGKCTHLGTKESNCLLVRDRHFDDQGLKVGVPGQWRPLPDGIEGFEHRVGIRDIVRVKRYRRSEAGQPTDLYVLDLVIESDVGR